MNFRTQILISKSNNPIDYNSRVVSLGSCFAVNIGDKFKYFKFNNIVNPFGILFHPQAIEKFIGFTAEKKQFTEANIFFHNERWHCFDAHSDLSNPDKNTLLSSLNTSIQYTNQQLANATHVIITLGTAWVYRNLETSNIVANCHKVPQKQFTKELLSVISIKSSLDSIIKNIQKLNPDAKIIFTVSPVRHIKDGFVENQRSKSHLITAIHEVLDSEKVRLRSEYFPSYEIMMDELRDYRFYTEDMLHPNKIAIDYIWQRFSDFIIQSSEARDIMKEVGSIQKALQHRSFNPESYKHQEFLKSIDQKIIALKEKNPNIQF